MMIKKLKKILKMINDLIEKNDDELEMLGDVYFDLLDIIFLLEKDIEELNKKYEYWKKNRK